VHAETNAWPVPAQASSRIVINGRVCGRERWGPAV